MVLGTKELDPKIIEKRSEHESQLFSQGRWNSSSSTAVESPLMQKALFGPVEKEKSQAKSLPL